MKKVLLVIIVIFLILESSAQSFNISDGNFVLDCNSGGTLFDNGGSGSDYTENQNLVFTLCPSTTGQVVSYQFVSGFFGSGDFLCVYDGQTTTDPLINCYNINSVINTNDLVRANINNISGCLTFQFSSDGDGNVGNFEIDLSCNQPCQSVEANIQSSSPAIDSIYIDMCFGDTLELIGEGIFNQNDINYTQSNASSTFYWDVGGVLDTTQIFTATFENAGFYPISLVVEDVNGCFSQNQLNLKVRQSPQAEFNLSGDSIICVNTSGVIFNQAFGEIQNGIIVVGDTISTSTQFNVTSDALYIPDDADGIAGNGITTPAIYEVAVTGFIPGSTISSGNQILNICLDIEHSFVGDLDIVLVAPDGTSIYLIDMNPPGGPGSNLGNPEFGVDPNNPGEPETYCWSPFAVNPPIDDNSNFGVQVPPGTYQAEGNWDDFIGSPVNGVWQIQVFDDWGGDDGNIFGASFEFDQVFIADPDTFIATYDAIGFWDPDPTIISSLNSNEITIQPDSIGFFTYYYNTTNNFDCIVRDTITIYADGLEVEATPSLS